MSDDDLHCMPWPMSLLCDLDDRLHESGSSKRWQCTLHDLTLRSWWHIRRVFHGAA
jgi:hypothetical protein